MAIAGPKGRLEGGAGTTDIDVMIARATAIVVVGLAVAAFGSGEAGAQYDRDGRYVPSPMGVPADPYARPVPNYPGTPGGAVGTPIWPRGAMPPPPAMQPRPADPPFAPHPSSRPLSKSQCHDGWSPRLGLGQEEFRARCRLILKQHHRRAPPAGS